MVNQNSIFGGMLTTQGAAKKTNCDALGIPWEPRYMLIGDANGADPVPNPAQTKLVNQVYRAQLNQLRVSPTDANILIAELVLPPDVGGWWIRELALEDKDGVFCAVANAAPSYKPLLAQGSGRNQVVRMHIITSGTSNIQLKIDPSVVLATRQYVDEAVSGLLPANKPAGTYTKVTVDDRGVFLSGSNPTTLAGFGITDTYTKAEIASIVAQASSLPVGSMVAFPKVSVPPGFLEIDGSVQSIATYPDLAAYLGTAFNKGDEGAGNFRLPESRGEFLRGWDHGRGIDAGRALGGAQGQSTEDHYHVTGVNDTALVALTQTARGVGSWPFGVSAIGVPGCNTINGAMFTTSGEDSWLNTGPNVSSGSGETRPRNLAVMWCIKAWNAPVNQGNIDIAALAAQVQELSVKGPIVGSARNGRMSVVAASASATYVADELVLETALGGQFYRLSSFNKTINLTTSGVGGMDTGAAPVSGFVGIYAIYNPTTKASGLLAVNATSAKVGEIYGGANMPAGYTASCLLTVLPTSPTAQFPIAVVRDREVHIASVYIYITSSLVIGALVTVSTVPFNAIAVMGSMEGSCMAAAQLGVLLTDGDAVSGTGLCTLIGGVVASGTTACPFRDVFLNANRQIAVTTSITGSGTATYKVATSGYKI